MTSSSASRVLAVFLILSATTASAFAQIEEVVVTGARAYDGASSSVFIVKRADHLITRVTVTCDTREPEKRREELKATLRNMIAEAKRSQTISLGLGDSILGELSEGNFDQIIVPDERADTSKAFVIIKTTIAATDNFNSATTRVRDFIMKTEKVGRTEILREERWDLTIIGPEQYRDGLIAQIVAQSKKTADLFGPGYAVSVDGLEHTVSWYQKGPLDLALYIPYSLHVAPLGSR